MPYRRDAAMAAAEFMVEMEDAVRRVPESHRATLTFGEISARPRLDSHRSGRGDDFL